MPNIADIPAELVPDEKCVDTGAEYPQTTLECPPLAVGSACDDGFNTTENDSCQDLEMPTCAGVCIAGYTDIQQFSVQWFEYTAASTTLITDIGSNHTELFHGSIHGQWFQVLADATAFWMAKSTAWPAQLYDEDGKKARAKGKTKAGQRAPILDPKTCEHRTEWLSTKGSNQYYDQVRCEACNLVLSKEATEWWAKESEWGRRRKEAKARATRTATRPMAAPTAAELREIRSGSSRHGPS